MKFLSFLLAFTLFTLAMSPCSDGQNINDHQTENTNHNHKEDLDDSCPATCICSCCGTSITLESATTFELLFYSKISTQFISTYQSTYRFDFQATIWQPPQLIS